MGKDYENEKGVYNSLAVELQNRGIKVIKNINHFDKLEEATVFQSELESSISNLKTSDSSKQSQSSNLSEQNLSNQLETPNKDTARIKSELTEVKQELSKHTQSELESFVKNNSSVKQPEISNNIPKLL